MGNIIGLLLIGASIVGIVYFAVGIVQDVRKKKNDKKDGDKNK